VKLRSPSNDYKSNTSTSSSGRKRLSDDAQAIRNGPRRLAEPQDDGAPSTRPANSSAVRVDCISYSGEVFANWAMTPSRKLGKTPSKQFAVAHFSTVSVKSVALSKRRPLLDFRYCPVSDRDCVAQQYVAKGQRQTKR
jgi:hypothetical protein